MLTLHVGRGLNSGLLGFTACVLTHRLVCFSVAVINTMTKATWEGRGFTCLICQHLPVPYLSVTMGTMTGRVRMIIGKAAGQHSAIKQACFLSVFKRQATQSMTNFRKINKDYKSLRDKFMIHSICVFDSGHFLRSGQFPRLMHKQRNLSGYNTRLN